ncbi:acetolactate synthase 2 small subunit [Rodentibacter caecimuris]|uniref:Acetolactate synthase 2 small subunit n=1 Tax=Rodentibacter caecimuris TaxID=1796644 RepID=A0ABX3KZY6_9PAST|nr:acetolactate synthase 2 small subunit [Rodentibacter heylii]
MQTYQIKMAANKRPETLERILRVIRHRGFEVRLFSTEICDNLIHIQTTVQSERAIELLLNQLVKLPDVVELN